MSENYTNRTDLMAQPVRTAKSKTYGDAAASAQKQKAIPLRQAVIPIGAPTQRPQEPITAGADFGPGPSMAGAGIPSPAPLAPQAGVNPRQDLIDQVRYVYSKNPNTAVFQLLAELEGTPLQ